MSNTFSLNQYIFYKSTKHGTHRRFGWIDKKHILTTRHVWRWMCLFVQWNKLVYGVARVTVHLYHKASIHGPNFRRIEVSAFLVLDYLHTSGSILSVGIRNVALSQPAKYITQFYANVSLQLSSFTLMCKTACNSFTKTSTLRNSEPNVRAVVIHWPTLQQAN